MNPYVTGEAIRSLREKNRLTQSELADRIGVSDKAVSRWETGKGYPDITLLEPLAEALMISTAELLSGNTVTNENVSANMLRSVFYVCPVCGNIVHSMGQAAGTSLSVPSSIPMDTTSGVIATIFAMILPPLIIFTCMHNPIVSGIQIKVNI